MLFRSQQYNVGEIKFDATEVVVLGPIMIMQNVARGVMVADGILCRRARKLQRSGGYKAVSDAI